MDLILEASMLAAPIITSAANCNLPADEDRVEDCIKLTGH
jgi:hypothetical protein